MIEEWINKAILFFLAISTLFQVLNWTGLMPMKLKNKLKMNKAEDTLEVLKHLGVDIDKYRRTNSIMYLPVDYPEDIKKEVKKSIKETQLKMKVSVGKRRSTEKDYYYDLIGHSCDPKFAELFARLLCTYWVTAVKEGLVKNSVVDFIVTPKGGSPILGYEFAKIMEKPLVLHEERDRFYCEEDDMHKRFDCANKPIEGSNALIVDDSTTGGRMVLCAINDLKKYGYRVTECLVVFEPQTKDARRKLENENVNLISILKTHPLE